MSHLTERPSDQTVVRRTSFWRQQSTNNNTAVCSCMFGVGVQIWGIRCSCAQLQASTYRIIGFHGFRLGGPFCIPRSLQHHTEHPIGNIDVAACQCLDGHLTARAPAGNPALTKEEKKVYAARGGLLGDPYNRWRPYNTALTIVQSCIHLCYLSLSRHSYFSAFTATPPLQIALTLPAPIFSFRQCLRSPHDCTSFRCTSELRYFAVACCPIVYIHMHSMS